MNNRGLAGRHVALGPAAAVGYFRLFPFREGFCRAYSAVPWKHISCIIFKERCTNLLAKCHPGREAQAMYVCIKNVYAHVCICMHKKMYMHMHVYVCIIYIHTCMYIHDIADIRGARD